MAKTSQLTTFRAPPSQTNADAQRASILVRTLPDTISGDRGSFHPRIVAREDAHGTWEAWLEFVPVATTTWVSYSTPIETHQHSRTAVERWASGITRVYAEGALGRTVLGRSR